MRNAGPMDEKDGTLPGGVGGVASALAVHSFLHISSCVLLHSSSFLPHNCALCTYTSSVLSLARSLLGFAEAIMMSSAQLRLMSDLKSIRQEPPEVADSLFIWVVVGLQNFWVSEASCSFFPFVYDVSLVFVLCFGLRLWGFLRDLVWFW